MRQKPGRGELFKKLWIVYVFMFSAKSESKECNTIEYLRIDESETLFFFQAIKQ
jgi:hypothetical protein